LGGYVHPEFGGFCPTPRLRRELRVALFSILLGAIGGAAGVIALSAGHNPTSTKAHVTAADAPIRPVTMEATSTPGHGSSLPQADLATHDGSTKKEKIDGVSAAPAPAASHVGNPTCQASASGGNEDCLAIKPRRVRVRAVTDGPAMARIALGRTTAQTPSMSPQDMPTTTEQSAETSETSAASGSSSTPRAEQKVSENRSQSATPSKKVKKTALREREKRRRKEWENDSPWIERADNSASRVGTFGRAYAREASYGRKGFWEWSW
jgi:hypothetical protein